MERQVVKKGVKDVINYPPMTKVTNQHQMEVNGKVKESQEVISDELERIFDSKVSEDLVKKTNAVYSFSVTDQGTDWFLDLKNGSGACGQGASPVPVDANFKMSSANFGKMFAGKLKPTAAFMTGRLKIEGNMGKAMKLEKLMGKMQSRGFHTVGNSRL